MGESRRPDDEDPFARLQALGGHLWDCRALVQLADATQPVRRAALARMITQATGEHVADAQIDRALRRLGGRGLVRFDVDAGHKLYRLTRSGRERVALLRQLVDLLGHPPRQGHHAVSGTVADPPPAGSPRVPGPDARTAVLDEAGLAREWVAALTGITPVGLTHRECQQILGVLATRIHTAVTASAAGADRDAGRDIGADLYASFRDPRVLARTITMLTTRLPPGLPQPGPQTTTATTRLIEQIIVGFVAAARDDTLDAQESLHRARICSSCTESPHRLTQRRPRRVTDGGTIRSQ